MYLCNLPIYILYYIFPFISIFFIQLGFGNPNYEFFWVSLLILSPWLSTQWEIDKKHFFLLLIISIAFFLKYIIPYTYIKEDIVLRALVMDGKWIIYVILSILWVNFTKTPSIKTLYSAGIFFSKVYIIYSILLFIKQGISVRPSIIGEANYDGLLILIPFCFIKETKGRFKDYLLFSIATLCTGSRTGIITLFILLTIITLKSRPKLVLLFIPIIISLIIGIFTFRGFSSIESIDRFVFFSQAFAFFQNTDWKNLLFGAYPGTSLNMPVLDSFGWYIGEFEGKNNIVGIFPFYFHSTYIRLAMTWGIPFLSFFLLYLVIKLLKNKYLPIKLLITIILLQSISLSTMTLTNVSFILFLAILIAIKANKSTT